MSPEVKRFRRIAYRRYEEAACLLANRFPTGAVYLAGYAVECIMKSLALCSRPQTQHGAVVATFRGVRAHDFEWIRQTYFGHLHRPKDIIQDIRLIRSQWSSALRYETKELPYDDAAEFIGAAKRVLEWCEGRIA